MDKRSETRMEKKLDAPQNFGVSPTKKKVSLLVPESVRVRSPKEKVDS